MYRLASIVGIVRKSTCNRLFKLLSKGTCYTLKIIFVHLTKQDIFIYTHTYIYINIQLPIFKCKAIKHFKENLKVHWKNRAKSDTSAWLNIGIFSIWNTCVLSLAG